MKVKTIVEDGERYHIIQGSRIQCSSTKDCPHCLQERTQVVENWISYHNHICILCDEKPPCYVCLREKCKEWCKDKAWIEENGSHAGCSQSIDRAYCKDFECKHGFLGWWMNGWLDAFEKRGKAIETNLLKELLKKEKDNGNNEEPEKPVRQAQAIKKKPAT